MSSKICHSFLGLLQSLKQGYMRFLDAKHVSYKFVIMTYHIFPSNTIPRLIWYYIDWRMLHQLLASIVVDYTQLLVNHNIAFVVANNVTIMLYYFQCIVLTTMVHTKFNELSIPCPPIHISYYVCPISHGQMKTILHYHPITYLASFTYRYSTL